ncbi:hypothetical protein POM88_006243 [Heracleum sosnowskyi]|uniref:Uncharacterized protein n=1 Tax=Heracleum sosnowskyi TaxID=360622 RepID=A0AAD8J287_9APIA|nr:hypothetical protein POM88_006243 [Heracleum sosnowskyi]
MKLKTNKRSIEKLELEHIGTGETYEMLNDLVVRPYKTRHVIPSQVVLSKEVPHMVPWCSGPCYNFNVFKVHSFQLILSNSNHEVEGKLVSDIHCEMFTACLYLLGPSKSGIEITDAILSPEVAFRETTSDFFVDLCSANALKQIFL